MRTLPLPTPTETAPFLTSLDITAIEREAHRLRAEALAGLFRSLFRRIGRLLHIAGTPAHG
ncbi:MAG: hypothetical protein VR70_10605 [Rhodospirillaceae bacterium BRH_c57]|nr:MAG: hypothetical protein VR70_10605 [Rhodospirillaceae bacterium BRH_c57]